MPHELDTIQSRISAALNDYAVADEPGQQSKLLKEIATLLVDARARMLTPEGEPDWRGRTYAYRQWVTAAWDATSLDGDARTNAMGSIRYHVGNALRERVDAASLEALGMRVEGPKERSVEKRMAQAETLKVVRGGQPLTDADEIAEALTMATTILKRIEIDALDEYSNIERRALHGVAVELAEKAGALAGHLGL